MTNNSVVSWRDIQSSLPFRALPPSCPRPVVVLLEPTEGAVLMEGTEHGMGAEASPEEVASNRMLSLLSSTAAGHLRCSCTQARGTIQSNPKRDKLNPSCSNLAVATKRPVREVGKK